MTSEIGFHENIRFPEDISWGTRGGPMFKTRVFTSHRGFEQRNSEWREPMMSFNVAYGVKTDVQMHRLIAFFQARRGRAYGFRYKNWIDYRVDAGLVAVGDGVNRRLALYTEKSVGAYKFYKRLRKIVPGTVTSVLRDTTSVVEGSDFVVNYNTGEIIFDSPVAYGVPVYATLEFDEPVRFDIDSLQVAIDAYNSNSIASIPLVTFRGNFGEIGEDTPITNEFTDQEILYLEFVEGSGTSTDDLSPVNHSVTFNGTAAMTSPIKFGISSGVLTPGSSGYVSLSGTNFQFGSSPFTVETFATKPVSGDNNQPIVSLWDNTSQKSWKLNYDRVNNKIEFKISLDGSTEIEVLSYPWLETSSPRMTHISIDRQPNNWYTLRINGVLVDSKKQAGALHASTASLTIGAVASPITNEGSYRGNIDSVRITKTRNRYLGFDTVSIPDVSL